MNLDGLSTPLETIATSYVINTFGSSTSMYGVLYGGIMQICTYILSSKYDINMNDLIDKYATTNKLEEIREACPALIRQ